LPRGGARKGAGRKKGSANIKSRQIVDEAAANGTMLPLQHLLGILNDPKASQSRKDWAAGCAASYCHPRLSASATASMNAPGAPASSDIPPVSFKIISIPRGGQLGPDDKIIWPDGTLTDPPPFEPFKATPDWTQRALTHQPEPEPLPFEATEAAVPENVTVLHPYQRRQSSDDDGSAGAA
jgi:hypothetical protein